MLTIFIFGLGFGLFMGLYAWQESRMVGISILWGLACAVLGALLGLLIASLLPHINLSCTLWMCH